MIKSEQINELSKGLSLFREKLKQPFKDADNPFFKSKYVPLENVTEVIDEALKGTGLTYVQIPLNGEGGTVGVATTLMHSSGQWIEFPPFLLKPDKANPQGYGSSITYARRYSLSSVFGITSDNDDDGNAASGNGSSNPNQARVSQRQVPDKVVSQPTKAEAMAKAKELKKSISDIKEVPPKQVDDWLLDYMKVKSVSDITDWNKAVVWLMKTESRAKELAGG